MKQLGLFGILNDIVHVIFPTFADKTARGVGTLDPSDMLRAARIAGDIGDAPVRARHCEPHTPHPSLSNPFEHKVEYFRVGDIVPFAIGQLERSTNSEPTLEDSATEPAASAEDFQEELPRGPAAPPMRDCEWCWTNCTDWLFRPPTGKPRSAVNTVGGSVASGVTSPVVMGP